MIKDVKGRYQSQDWSRQGAVPGNADNRLFTDRQNHRGGSLWWIIADAHHAAPYDQRFEGLTLNEVERIEMRGPYF
jgi:hypothetical protein